MSGRALARVFVAYAIALCAVAGCLHAVIYLDPRRTPTSTRIVSDWKAGERVARAVAHDDRAPGVTEACAAGDCTRVIERIVDEGPLPIEPAWLFGFSVAAGRDGIAVQLDDQTTYFTPEDLLAQQVSRDGMKLGSFAARIGLDNPDALLARMARQLNVDADHLRARARMRRFIVQREDPATRLWPLAAARGRALTPAMLEQAARGAGEYLVRNQTDEGRFVYELDAIRGTENSDYNLPRHGGTTLFLAEVAAATRDPRLTAAAMRAAQMVQRQHTVDCGPDRCIGDANRVHAGSTALILLAYVELARAGVGASLEPDIRALAKFLRSLQRPDGEFMHVYSRSRRRAVDVQVEFYSGEIVFALARAHRLTRDPADLSAASAGLAYLTRRSLYQNRYYYGSEHWTCQAVEELWDRAPDRGALDFCLDFQTFNRPFQVSSASEFGDFEGGIAPNPFSPPRLTSTGSRTEAAVATLATALDAGRSPAELRDLVLQVQHAIAFMLRFQFSPGPRHLLSDPTRVEGGMPGSPTDMRVRIDFLQHAVSGVLRYMRLVERYPALASWAPLGHIRPEFQCQQFASSTVSASPSVSRR